MKPDTFAEKESAMERFLKQLIPGIAGLLIVILGAYIVWFSSAKVSHDSGDWGTLGDYFGGLMNPVISFATLMVAFAVWKQQKVELRETKVALEEQAKTAEQQRQEQRFFDLLTVLQRVESSLRFTTPTRDRIDLHGKNAIQQRLNHLPIEFSITFKLGLGQKFNLGGNEIEITHSHLKNEWPKLEIEAEYGTFLRTIYRILSDAENLLGDNRYRYVKLFRAQLTTGELSLIAWSIWLDEDYLNLKNKIIEYGLLKHFPKNGMRQELAKTLPVRAFGNGAMQNMIEHTPASSPC